MRRNFFSALLPQRSRRVEMEGPCCFERFFDASLVACFGSLLFAFTAAAELKAWVFCESAKIDEVASC